MDLQPDNNQETIILGRVSGHYGVKGWVKVFSYTKPMEGILSYSECYIEGVEASTTEGYLRVKNKVNLLL
jgi:16S rRNA processing protein RimM